MILLVYCEFCDLFIGLRVLNRYLIDIRNSDYFRIKFDDICRLCHGFFTHGYKCIRSLLANDDEYVLSLLHPMIFLVYCEFRDLFIGFRVLNRYLIGIRNSDYFRIKFDGICRLCHGFFTHRHERIRSLLANDDEHVLSLLHPMIFLVYCEFRDLFIGLRVLNRYLIGIRNSDYFRIKFDGICRLCHGFFTHGYKCIRSLFTYGDDYIFSLLHPMIFLVYCEFRDLFIRLRVLNRYLIGIRNSDYFRIKFDGICRLWCGFGCGFRCGFNSALLVYRYECIWIFVPRDDVDSFADLHPVFVLGDGHLRQLLVRFSILQAYLVGVRNSGHLRGNYDGSSR
ncbi:hypothetical protein NY2A_b194L [Paramecium bursaria Chlorella virus NY2A]|uniref:Uncharacterized protein b194L n=1 Tax=Paramecium bursaria Chlorella virus NY2A TaxID=46021 RepID=A7IW69_PBCVN|nr:hypothetical protein NY2A_b194L [Paramecium bursaria Chlorella virus NY2A]ABT14593.1 hypothetical protein NY2A_b194L [Paramecium bursaria Chlorella virus NY2A]